MYQISEITSTRNIIDIIDFLRQLKKKNLLSYQNVKIFYFSSSFQKLLSIHYL